MKQLHCYVFVAVIFLVSILNMAYSPDTKLADNVEKPVLTVQTLTSGDYFRKFEDYFQKNFMLRMDLITIYNDISEFKGIKTKESMQIVKINDDNLAQTALASAPDRPKENFNVIKEDWGQLLIYKNIGVGINIYNKDACIGLADSINLYKQKFPALDISVLMTPTHVEIMAQDYDIPTYSQKETIDIFYAGLDESITKIDAYSKLVDHRSEYIFFNTDHHWTPRGAYYAYTAFMESKGQHYIDLNNFDTYKIDNFLGTYYTMTLNDALKRNADYLDVYDINNENAVTIFDEQGEEQATYAHIIDQEFIKNPDISKYNIFLNGDHPLVKITTNADNNKKILIVKDSFANAFVPYLTNHYEEIYMLDARLFVGDIKDIVDENQIAEMLFLNNALRTNNQTYEEVLRALLDRQN